MQRVPAVHSAVSSAQARRDTAIDATLLAPSGLARTNQPASGRSAPFRSDGTLLYSIQSGTQSCLAHLSLRSLKKRRRRRFCSDPAVLAEPLAAISAVRPSSISMDACPSLSSASA
eukprot:scaffold279_cov229-Pinguiococcus_pyrenoidosus.AAC.12